jgi:transcriptional regulator with XRE-family HTH domain
MRNPVELGQYLAQLRDKAGYKQVELAKKITWSPAVLSRVESGERPVSEEELADLLAAIGTQEARGVAQVLTRKWDLIPEPPLGHADQDLLWNAETVANDLRRLRTHPDFKHAFERRLTEYLDELANNAARTRSRLSEPSGLANPLQFAGLPAWKCKAAPRPRHPQCSRQEAAA